MQGEESTEPMTPMTAARKKITSEDFTIKYRLGKGAYGDVFLVVKNSDHKAYAFKQIQKRKLEREQKQYQAMVEKELLTNFKHPGIVKLRYSFQDKHSLYFVQEYCEGGQFMNFIRANIEKLPEKVKVFYIGQMVNLLQYIHSVGVTHRDLKPENLMIDKRGHLKLIDFGTAEISECSIVKQEFKEHIIKLKKKADEKDPNKMSSGDQNSSAVSEVDSPLKRRRSTFVGTCYYIAPQLLEQNYCPHSADLWALGCIIYQMYYLETPFKDSYEFAVFEKIKNCEYDFPANDMITEDAIDIIKKLLVKKPEERLGSGGTEELSFGKLKAHPYFKGLDIQKIFDLPVPYIPGLQPVEPTEQQKAEYKQTYETFKGRTSGTLQLLKDEYELQILRHEIMQEKTFVFHSHIFLVLCEVKDLYIVTADEFQKINTITLTKQQGNYSKLIDKENFLIYDEQRIIQLRSPNAQEWVTAINS